MFFIVCVCVCAHVCVQRHAHVTSYVCQHRQATLFETGSLVSPAYAWLAGLITSTGSPVSACRIPEVTEDKLRQALGGW